MSFRFEDEDFAKLASGVYGKFLAEASGFSFNGASADIEFVIILPRASHSLHHHLLCTQFYYVISGVGELILIEGARKLERGSHFIVQPGLGHSITTKSELNLLCVSVPRFATDDVHPGAYRHGKYS